MSDPHEEEKLVGADRVLAVLIDLAGYPQGATLDEMPSASAVPSRRFTGPRQPSAAPISQNRSRGVCTSWETSLSDSL